MTEQELRVLVREAIAKQKGGGLQPSDGAFAGAGPEHLLMPPSHAQFGLPGGGDACIIEPSVPCTHCGYCKSYGH
jgi:hypothetical protein